MSDNQESNDNIILPPFYWSSSKRVYIWRSNGREVSQARLSDWVREAIGQSKKNLRAIGRSLLDGQINRAEFALQSGTEIKNLHRALAMLANGGRDQMTVRNWGAVGGILNRELSYFQRFAAQVDSVELELLGDKFLARLESYSKAGWGTFINSYRNLKIAAGDQEEMNVLGMSLHSCSECISLTEMGYVPAGTLPAIGSRSCQGSCNCEIIYKTVGAVSDEVAA